MAFVVLGASILFIVFAIVVVKLHPFLALILAGMLVGLASPVPLGEGDTSQAVLAVELTATGFGGTAANIGIVIVLAAIIGQCLMESGAADRIVSALLKWFGERRAGASLMGSGYLLSVPVFFDTVFFLLVPLARTLRARTGAHYVVYVMAIAGGAIITHSLVPPTPGPLVMADALGIDLGVAIGGGLLLGLIPAGAGLAFAHAVDARLTIAFKATALERAPNPERALPGLTASLLPVILPVALITGHSFVDLLARRDPGTWSALLPWTAFFGNKNLALLLAAFVAAGVLMRQANLTLGDLSRRLEPAVTSAGVIILITCAGGAFGSMLARIGIDEGLRGMMSEGSGLGILLVAFATAVVMKTAQGSGTVAMITTSGIMAALLPDSGELPFHRLYVYAAIGFGSGVISWMNDSAFWVICKMSDFTEKETFVTWTLMLVIIGAVGFVEVLVLSQLLPLV
jgi:GntP family gluconate:H+ symporter